MVRAVGERIGTGRGLPRRPILELPLQVADSDDEDSDSEDLVAEAESGSLDVPAFLRRQNEA